MAAGQADGIDAWPLDAEERETVATDTFLPTTTEDGVLIFLIIVWFGCNFLLFSERNLRYKKWKMAVQRSLGWAISKKSDLMTGWNFIACYNCFSNLFISDERYRLLASVPAGFFLISSFSLLALSEVLRNAKSSM